MTRPRTFVYGRRKTVVLFVLLFALNSPVLARSGTLLFLAGLTLEQAAKQVQRLAGGRILGAETRNVGGRNIYIIKILTPDGKRVKHFQVDAESGQVRGGGR